MELYAEKIRIKTGKDKINAFCEAVKILNLNDEEVQIFAYMCKFMLASKIKV